MKKNPKTTPVTRGQKLGLGMAASSGSIVMAANAAGQMGGPILAAGVAVGFAALAAILLFVFRDRRSAVADKSAQDGAVEALSAL